MGNTHTTNSVQNGSVDSHASGGKVKCPRKNSNVKERVLARFTSKKSLKDANVTKLEIVCECGGQPSVDDETHQQTARTYEQSAVDAADEKRFSQISQGADSAKDALDCGEHLYIYYCFVFIF